MMLRGGTVWVVYRGKPQVKGRVVELADINNPFYPRDIESYLKFEFAGKEAISTKHVSTQTCGKPGSPDNPGPQQVEPLYTSETPWFRGSEKPGYKYYACYNPIFDGFFMATSVKRALGENPPAISYTRGKEENVLLHNVDGKIENVEFEGKYLSVSKEMRILTEGFRAFYKDEFKNDRCYFEEKDCMTRGKTTDISEEKDDRIKFIKYQFWMNGVSFYEYPARDMIFVVDGEGEKDGTLMGNTISFNPTARALAEKIVGEFVEGKGHFYDIYQEFESRSYGTSSEGVYSLGKI